MGPQLRLIHPGPHPATIRGERIRGAAADFLAAAGSEPSSSPTRSARVVAAVVARVAAALGRRVELVLDGRPVVADPGVLAACVDEEVLRAVGPWLPGAVREGLVDTDRRAAEGVHHTGPAVAAAVVELAFDAGRLGPDVVVGDPAVGGGVFLLAAGEHMAAGASRSDVVHRLRGVDVDPLAVATTRAALELWSGTAVPDGHIRRADFLGPAPFAAPVDLIVGNPPFAGQLRGPTRDSSRRRSVGDRWPGVGGYADDAALFLLAALEAVTAGGTVALLQPLSVLVARDVAAVRRRVLDAGAVTGFWYDGERVFDAAVDTCAVVVSEGRAPGPVTRRVGPAGETSRPAGPVSDDAWGVLAADLVGVPPVDLVGEVTVGDVARCTAGFRDQYYGLRGAVRDDPAGAVRLVTSGLIDPLQCLWGRRDCRFDRRRFAAPTVDLDRIDPAIAEWVEHRLTPKLVVATQTRVIEAAVDVAGTWLPSTPVVSVEPRDDSTSLWHLAAALTAPQASAWMARRAIGSALSRTAMRVSASALASLPLPSPGRAWDRAAAAARGLADTAPEPEALSGVASLAAEAYGPSSPELLDWWSARRP